MASSPAAREAERPNVYQLPVLRTVTAAPPVDISLVLERLNALADQQKEILQVLEQTSKREPQTTVSNVSSIAFPGSLSLGVSHWQTLVVTSGTPWSLDALVKDRVAATTVVSYVPAEPEEPRAASVGRSGLPDVRLTSDGIPLPKLLSVVSVVLFAFSVTSLATWLIGNIPLIHPVMALMSLLATPFIYWMGRVAKSDLEGQRRTTN